MLTRAGVLTLLLSVASGAAAVLFGVPELFLAAVVSAGLTLVAVAVVSVRPPLWVTATPASRRVPCGTPLGVLLRAGNGARRRAIRSADIVDVAADLPAPALALGRLPSGAVVETSYHLSSDRRGWRDIGPLWIEMTDPFGLARLRHSAAPRSRVLVWPRVEDMGALPEEIDAAAEQRRRARFIGGAETDFHSLRRYEPGDNPHRIHWPSSTRYRELLVRRFETFEHPETLIYLETDPAVASARTFERIVSTAAGLATAAAASGGVLRLFTRAGSVTTTTGGPAPLLDALALVAQHPPGELRAPFLPEAPPRATLLAIIGDVDPERPLVLPTAPGRRIVVQFWEQGRPLAHPEVVTVGPEESPADRWRAHWPAGATRAGADGGGRAVGAAR